MAQVQTWIADAEARRERLQADGSLWLVPGSLVEATYVLLNDSLHEAVRDGQPGVEQRLAREWRAARIAHASRQLRMMAALAA